VGASLIKFAETILVPKMLYTNNNTFSGFCRKVFRVNLEYAPFTGAFNQQISRLATIRLNVATKSDAFTNFVQNLKDQST